MGSRTNSQGQTSLSVDYIPIPIITFHKTSDSFIKKIWNDFWEKLNHCKYWTETYNTNESKNTI